MDNLPKPFGYVRDGGNPGHVFQHTPFSEQESLMFSTAPVYSHEQMREMRQAGRKQALSEAYDAMFSLKGDKVTRFDAQTAVRALEGRKATFSDELLAVVEDVYKVRREGDGLGQSA